MKNLLLLSALFIFSIAYAQNYQNKQGGNDPIEGIDIIIKKKYASWPIKNPNNNPQIHQINAMYKGNVKKSYSLKSSHTPNFSQPQKLADILLKVSMD